MSAKLSFCEQSLSFCQQNSVVLSGKNGRLQNVRKPNKFQVIPFMEIWDNLGTKPKSKGSCQENWVKLGILIQDKTIGKPRIIQIFRGGKMWGKFQDNFELYMLGIHIPAL